MSTSLNIPPLPRLRERSACMCEHGDVCTSFTAGHALHLIQARIAAATPSDWIDGIVDEADAATGALRVRTLDGTAYPLWNASGAALEAPAGTPVALHARYGVLAVGASRFNVAAG